MTPSQLRPAIYNPPHVWRGDRVGTVFAGLAAGACIVFVFTLITRGLWV